VPVEYHDLSEHNQSSKLKINTKGCSDSEANLEPAQPSTYSPCSPTSDISFVPEDEEVEDDDLQKPYKANQTVTTAGKKRKATDSDENNSKTALRKKSLRRKQPERKTYGNINLLSITRESTIEAEAQPSTVPTSTLQQRAAIEGPDVAIIPIENNTSSSAPEVLSQTFQELQYSVQSNSTYVHPVAANRLPPLPDQVQSGLMYAHRSPVDGMWVYKSRPSVISSYRSHPGAMPMSFMSDTSENVVDDYSLTSQSPVAISIPLLDQDYSPPLNGLPEFISTHPSFTSHTRPYSTPPLSVAAQSDVYAYTDTLCTSFGSYCNHNHQEDSVVSTFPRGD
jgi:hypothetical protein